MTYVDGFVIPIPKKNLAAYKKMAAEGARAWKKHGALEYFECVGDDLFPKDARNEDRSVPDARQSQGL